MSKKALIVMDIQNDYFENGAIELVNPIEASLKARKVIDLFREKNLPIVHIQHLSADPANMPVFVSGTFGSEILENVKPLKREKIIQKYYPNSFKVTDLLDFLKANEVTELIVTGMNDTYVCRFNHKS